MKYPRLLKPTALALTLAVGLALSARAGEHKDEKIAVKDLPAAVQKTILAHVEDGYVTEVEKETKKGTVRYCADVKLPDGRKLEIEVAEDGKLIKVKQDDDKDDEKEGENDKE